ncbi:hypothetical protein K456DRAFT_461372 [Colletotrichum gloeosporioides 23]|nr:hypothetical protein K456DRAFT_461372 [Colletotrichum gloeosporioides 23]
MPCVLPPLPNSISHCPMVRFMPNPLPIGDASFLPRSLFGVLKGPAASCSHVWAFPGREGTFSLFLCRSFPFSICAPPSPSKQHEVRQVGTAGYLLRCLTPIGKHQPMAGPGGTLALSSSCWRYLEVPYLTCRLEESAAAGEVPTYCSYLTAQYGSNTCPAAAICDVCTKIALRIRTHFARLNSVPRHCLFSGSASFAYLVEGNHHNLTVGLFSVVCLWSTSASASDSHLCFFPHLACTLNPRPSPYSLFLLRFSFF